MRNQINLPEIIHREFLASKFPKFEGYKPRMEKELYESLNEKQKHLFDNIMLALNSENNTNEKEAIKFALDFVASILQPKNNSRIFFD